jgi:hypothetical protein
MSTNEFRTPRCLAGWDAKRVIFGLSGLAYLVGGAFGSVEGGPTARIVQNAV